jgi:uncharacterized membrane protein
MKMSEKGKSLAQKILSLAILLMLGVAAYSVAEIGIAERQTFYYHIIFILLWLFTAGIGMKLYSAWTLSKYVSAGEDEILNQAERGYLMRVHSAILIAAAILVFGTILVYYGKKSDEIPYNYGANSVVIECDSTNTLRNTLQ